MPTNSQSINACAFRIEPCNNRHNKQEKIGAYKVYIDFFTDQERSERVSTKKFLMLAGEVSLTAPPVYDVYSYNGLSSSKLSKLLGKQNFSDETLDEIQHTTAVYHELTRQTIQQDAQVLFVLDLKDVVTDEDNITRRYTNSESIRRSETKMMEYICSTGDKYGEATIFRNKLHESNTTYAILEGRLKAELLETGFFSDAEKFFLQVDKTHGSPGFCEMIEFLLAGFKRGERAQLKIRNPDGYERICLERQSFFYKLNENAPAIRQPIGIRLYQGSILLPSTIPRYFTCTLLPVLTMS